MFIVCISILWYEPNYLLIAAILLIALSTLDALAGRQGVIVTPPHLVEIREERLEV